MNLASIDLGTNSFRLLIAEIEQNNIKFLYKKSIVSGLGKGFNNADKTLSAHSISNALKVLAEFSLILDQYKPDNIRAVATSIVRESTNSDKFIRPANKIIATNIDIISGVYEAQLTTVGVLNSVRTVKGAKLIVDIGGGSTEFSLADNNDKIISLCSINLGVVKAAEMFDLRNVISSSIKLGIIDYISSILDDNTTLKDICLQNISQIIVTSGTPTTLAAIDLGLKKYDRKRENGHILYERNILKMFNNLSVLPSVERLDIRGVSEGREDLIIPGTLIILEILRRFNKNSIIVSDGGLLEGLIYHQAKELCNNYM
ncbi:MAG: hypothetical protein GWO07_11795 [Candidatus Dadabacteria bacterium]|nr:hypothetical protein [Candidatus Dadabacteria bacterium]NIS09421.1 hypothetical protein [Candidatus Dadabacteria bacterium]NIV42572.1 hypothetical protein [Candidatus Dadabacteria bacterium]NIY22659.1 hypothetical protein [Candidatus Dadabacteria bacterium]